MRWPRRSLLRTVMVLGVTASLALGPPAWSDQITQGARPESPAAARVSTERSSKVAVVGNCSIVSSPRFIGQACPSGASKDPLTIAQILKDSEVPECWDIPLTEDELRSGGLTNQEPPNELTYIWRHYIGGINKKTKKPMPGGITIVSDLIGYVEEVHGPPCPKLDENQKNLFQMQLGHGNVPDPIVGTTPVQTPRVGQWVAFHDQQAETVEVRVSGSTSVVRARPVRVSFKPLGPLSSEKVECAAPGQRVTGEDKPPPRRDAGDPCWWRYLQSSAGEKNNTYQVQISTDWVVEVAPDGVNFQSNPPFDSFTKTKISGVRVSEIQALVVF